MTWSPSDCKLSVLSPVTHIWILPVLQHRHVLHFALSTFFGKVDISHCVAVFRNHCFAERFRPQVCNVFLALDSAYSQAFGCDFILSPQYATSMCFNLPIPCLWRMCSVAVASMANTSRNPDPSKTTQFLVSDAPNAAAYSSASALLLAMICCLRVYAFKV